MCGIVLCKRVRFAVATKIKVWAIDAFVSDASDGLVAIVTDNASMANGVHWFDLWAARLDDLNEGMLRVLGLGKSDAIVAKIKVGALKALVANAFDNRLAEIALRGVKASVQATPLRLGYTTRVRNRREVVIGVMIMVIIRLAALAEVKV